MPMTWSVLSSSWSMTLAAESPNFMLQHQRRKDDSVHSCGHFLLLWEDDTLPQQLKGSLWDKSCHCSAKEHSNLKSGSLTMTRSNCSEVGIPEVCMKQELGS